MGTTTTAAPLVTPDRRGIWLAEWNREDTATGLPYRPMEVRGGWVEGGWERLRVSGTSPSLVSERPDIRWLAEVPPPEALVALAEYAEILLRCDRGECETPEIINASIRLEALLRAWRLEAKMAGVEAGVEAGN